MVVRYEKVRVGLVGWNHLAPEICQLLLKYCKHIDLAALVTQDASVKDWAMRYLGVKHILSTYHGLLDLHEIDAVIILDEGKPTGHIIEAILAANYHVLYTPRFVSPTELDIVTQAIDQRPTLVAMPWMPHRYDSCWQSKEIKQLIIKEEIQKIGWKVQLKAEGKDRDQLLQSLLIEYIDILSWLTDSQVAWVTAEAQDQDRYEFLFRMDNKVIGTCSILLTASEERKELLLASSGNESCVSMDTWSIDESAPWTEMPALSNRSLVLLRNMDVWLHSIQEKVKAPMTTHWLKSVHGSVNAAISAIKIDGRVVVV